LAAFGQRTYRGLSTVTTAQDPRAIHIYLQGKLSAEIAPLLQQAIRAGIANGLVAVVHLNGVRQMDPAGLGLLMDARRAMLDAGLSLSLSGLSAWHRFLLHAWCATPLFDEWESPRTHYGLLASEAEANAFMNREKEAL